MIFDPQHPGLPPRRCPACATEHDPEWVRYLGVQVARFIADWTTIEETLGRIDPDER